LTIGNVKRRKIEDDAMSGIATQPAMAVVSTVVKRYGSVDEAGAYCGLSPRSIRQMLADKRLSAFRPQPGKVLVDLRELDALIRKAKGRRGTRGRHLHHSRVEAC
jgi:hypothetical protein